MSDNIKAIGSFVMEVIETATGRIIDRYSGENLVILNGKTNITKLLGGDVSGKAITQIAVGTNGTAPDLSDTGITNQFAKAIDSISYPAADTVQINAIINNDEANGMMVREAGLLLGDNTLFARKTREAIDKTNAIALNIIWKIKIA